MSDEQFFDDLDRLDQLLSSDDPKAGIAELGSLLSSEVRRAYFFDKLDSSKWIAPLADVGFFEQPPSTTDAKGEKGFPPWAAGRYLARMAKLPTVQDDVLRIVDDLPWIDNPRVHETMTELALNLPPSKARKLAMKAERWAESPNFWRPEKLGKLVAHLAGSGTTGEALRLARRLLAILPGPESLEPADARAHLSAEPRARFDVYEFERILNEDVPAVVMAAGIAALGLLCELLEDAMDLRRGRNDAPEDYSYIWRPAVEDHPQNHPFGLKDALVTSVRNAAEAIIGKEPDLLREVVGALESRPYRVFHRIAIHIVRRFADFAPDSVRRILLDQERFDDVSFQHEYYLLANEQFSRLVELDQDVILQWIEKGPDLGEYVASWRHVRHEVPSDEDVDRYRRGWQQQKLAPIIDSLPEKWRSRFANLSREAEQPKHPEFGSYSESWVGPESPVSRDELAAMSFDRLVEYLSNWEPSGASWSPSREGLGRLLSELIASDPERFVARAEDFKRLDPTFVYALFGGLRDAAREGRQFKWNSILALASWVVAQPREIPARKSEHPGLDTGWGWTRKAIADLLSASLGSEKFKPDLELQEQVWEVVEALTEDPEPTRASEEESDPSTMDPATASINTVRGEAMHAVVRYALWIRKHLEGRLDGPARLERGFDEMPKVRRVLDAHLDPVRDPSLAIRSVYGQWFPWLVLLDATWAVSSVERVFPRDTALSTLRDAAWATYVVMCPPYDNVFDVLRAQYSLAIDRLSRATAGRHGRDPDERLAEHLVLLYARGRVTLGDEDNLIASFFSGAPARIRAHAMSFAGRALHERGASISSEISERLSELWKWRIESIAREGAREECADELAAFGWWFTSAKFDEDWSIEQLKRATELSRKIDADWQVVGYLVGLADRKPRASVELLGAVLECSRRGAEFLGVYRQEDVGEVLRKAMASGDIAAQNIARSLINKLGAAGELSYRSLLRPQG